MKNPPAAPAFPPGYETPDYGILIKVDKSIEARRDKTQYSCVILNTNNEVIHEIKDQPRYHYLMAEAARFMYDESVYQTRTV